MANTDLYSNLAFVQLLEPQDTNDNDDQTSNLLDTLGFESAVVLVDIGTITGVGATASLLPTLQECDTTTGGSFGDVAAADMEGAFTLVDATTEDQCVQRVGYKGSKRYLRVKLDYTGTDITASLVSVTGVLGNPRVYPATAPAAVSAT
jgi:hypothetical protein